MSRVTLQFTYTPNDEQNFIEFLNSCVDTAIRKFPELDIIGEPCISWSIKAQYVSIYIRMASTN